MSCIDCMKKWLLFKVAVQSMTVVTPSEKKVFYQNNLESGSISISMRDNLNAFIIMKYEMDKWLWRTLNNVFGWSWRNFLNVCVSCLKLWRCYWFSIFKKMQLYEVSRLCKTKKRETLLQVCGTMENWFYTSEKKKQNLQWKEILLLKMISHKWEIICMLTERENNPQEKLRNGFVGGSSSMRLIRNLCIQMSRLLSERDKWLRRPLISYFSLSF